MGRMPTGLCILSQPPPTAPILCPSTAPALVLLRHPVPPASSSQYLGSAWSSTQMGGVLA